MKMSYIASLSNIFCLGVPLRWLEVTLAKSNVSVGDVALSGV